MTLMERDEFLKQERCSICGWPTCTGELMDHEGKIGCCLCRRWVQDEGRKAAEHAANRTWDRAIRRLVDGLDDLIKGA